MTKTPSSTSTSTIGPFRGRPRWGELTVAGVSPLAGILLLSGVLACERGRPGGASAGDAASAQPPAPEASAAGGKPADSVAQPFARPVVVFMEASPEEIQAARAGMSEEDYYVMADDLSFYRSSAWEYLQKRRIPVVRVTGRQPLRFVVADTVRSYDFGDDRTLDLLVVFDGRRPPHALAPVDVQQVDTLFGAGADSAGA